jgi:hypothetical protein
MLQISPAFPQPARVMFKTMGTIGADRNESAPWLGPDDSFEEVRGRDCKVSVAYDMVV